MKNRLFLALPAVIDDYGSLQKAFDGVITGRWVAPENLHLTLSFFGDSFETAVLTEQLSTLSLPLTPLPIRGVGYFPKNRILYAGVEDAGLADVYRSVNTLLGLPVNAGFVAHVTLMRVKQIADREALKALLQRYEKADLGTLKAEALLMQSELLPDGARYSVVKRF